MSIHVLKFGGTSVADADRIRNVGKKVIERHNRGQQIIVVVSAMGKSTDHLVNLANELSSRPSKRELDMLLSTGEQVTISLLAMYLENQGYPSVSLTGWQAGIMTEPSHTNARILNIHRSNMTRHLDEGKIVIVAGFQGITETGEITTLGRGGSDTTAVAIAAACSAERCDIYTDVSGVYSTDPRYVKEARKLKEISYDEMLEMAYLGAGVLHPRAVEYAKNYQLPLVVRSSFDNDEGTMIREEVQLEKDLSVRGLAFDKGITKITLQGLPNELTTLSGVFTTLAQNGINVDIIIQNTTDTKTTTLSFSIDHTALKDTLDILNQYKEQLGFSHIDIETDLAKVSIVGSGMVSNPGVAAQMFQTLADHQVKVKMVSTSEIKVSTVIALDQLETALKVLHSAFELDRVPELTVDEN